MTAGVAPAQPTVIGPTMLVQGEVYASEGIHVRGRLEGTLHVNGGRLVIEEGGSVAAMVRAACVVVHGLLLGDTVASSSLTVCRVQFRAEAFNFTNSPMFGMPNQSFGSAAFGTITSAQNTPRQLQLALRLFF